MDSGIFTNIYSIPNDKIEIYSKWEKGTGARAVVQFGWGKDFRGARSSGTGAFPPLS